MRRVLGVIVTGVLLAVGVLGSPSAQGAVAGPGLSVESVAMPSVFSSEQNSEVPDTYMLTVTNTGSVNTNGQPIVVSDVLPAVLRALTVEADALMVPEALSVPYSQEIPAGVLPCAPVSVRVQCTYEGVLKPGEDFKMLVTVGVAAGASGVVTNTASVSGGGAVGAVTSEPTRLGSAAEETSASFGVQDLSFHVYGPDGREDVQAGSHPYEQNLSFVLNTVANVAHHEYTDATVGGRAASIKDIVTDLPEGFLGNPAAIERCPQYKVPLHSCPPSSQIGVAKVLQHPVPGRRFQSVQVSQVYNVIPDKGYPGQFEFMVTGVPIVLYATVDPKTNYAARVTVADVPEVGGVVGTTISFFGTPAADKNYLDGNTGSGGAATAFLENPTGCTSEPRDSTFRVDAWQAPGATLPEGAPDLSDANWISVPTNVFSQVTGCEALQFLPSLEVRPETVQADEPSGLTVKLSVPQAPLEEAYLGSPALRSVTVTLPAGLSVNPSAADGLQGCSAAQFGLGSATPGACPDGSVLGSVRGVTPLLSEPLSGQVFLADPKCDPCNSADAQDGNMFGVYMEFAGSGVVIKQAGTIYVDPSTGQLTTTVSGLPQDPVSDIEVHFKGGLHAGLATPQSCGTFTTTSDLTPWSAPATPDRTPSSPFTIGWDEHGAACPAQVPFAPVFEAGTANPDAGQYSPLTVSFDREDREQDLAGIQVRMPPGLLGSLTGVVLCGEPQADLGTCPAASEIGSMTVAAGAGGHPFYEHGHVFLTGPYKHAPFGLSIVVPTVAGPFNLGNVVVRAQVDIDPSTTALTVTSDPLPQIIDGVPLRLRLANVTVDRPGFTLNPTDCALQHIEATLTGSQGAVAHQSVPFAVSGCAGLHFGPSFKVSTTAHTSKARGASLDARLSIPPGAQSNIAKVKVDLPKQLPSRLTTLQKACPDSTFAANPAACPAGSLIGAVQAVTPILPVPLVGPVYFVSHGGAAFPDLIAVLQGYGVRVDLVGATFISKKGITSSTFTNVPDVPVSTFEIYLPQGPGSALSANGNLCASKLSMPTLFTAQDGAQFKQDTRIAVTGCPKTKTKKKAKQARRARASTTTSNGRAHR